MPITLTPEEVFKDVVLPLKGLPSSILERMPLEDLFAFCSVQVSGVTALQWILENISTPETIKTLFQKIDLAIKKNVFKPAEEKKEDEAKKESPAQPLDAFLDKPLPGKGTILHLLSRFKFKDCGAEIFLSHISDCALNRALVKTNDKNETVFHLIGTNKDYFDALIKRASEAAFNEVARIIANNKSALENLIEFRKNPGVSHRELQAMIKSWIRKSTVATIDFLILANPMILDLAEDLILDLYSSMSDAGRNVINRSFPHVFNGMIRVKPEAIPLFIGMITGILPPEGIAKLLCKAESFRGKYGYLSYQTTLNYLFQYTNAEEIDPLLEKCDWEVFRKKNLYLTQLNSAESNIKIFQLLVIHQNPMLLSRAWSDQPVLALPHNLSAEEKKKAEELSNFIYRCGQAPEKTLHEDPSRFYRIMLPHLESELFIVNANQYFSVLNALRKRPPPGKEKDISFYFALASHLLVASTGYHNLGTQIKDIHERYSVLMHAFEEKESTPFIRFQSSKALLCHDNRHSVGNLSKAYLGDIYSLEKKALEQIKNLSDEGYEDASTFLIEKKFATLEPQYNDKGIPIAYVVKTTEAYTNRISELDANSQILGDLGWNTLTRFLQHEVIKQIKLEPEREKNARWNALSNFISAKLSFEFSFPKGDMYSLKSMRQIIKDQIPAKRPSSIYSKDPYHAWLEEMDKTLDKIENNFEEYLKQQPMQAMPAAAAAQQVPRF